MKKAARIWSRFLSGYNTNLETKTLLQLCWVKIRRFPHQVLPCQCSSGYYTTILYFSLHLQHARVSFLSDFGSVADGPLCSSVNVLSGFLSLPASFLALLPQCQPSLVCSASACLFSSLCSGFSATVAHSFFFVKLLQLSCVCFLRVLPACGASITHPWQVQILGGNFFLFSCLIQTHFLYVTQCTEIKMNILIYTQNRGGGGVY